MVPLEFGLTAPQNEIVSFFIASCVCVLILTGFVLTSDQLEHWFVIPVLVCGVIIGSDAVAWMRGRMNLLDPAGILGLIGFHFFFLAPLLHVLWDQWMPYIDPPRDWRPWLGGMAVLNCLGLFIYRFSRGSHHNNNILTRVACRQPIWRLAPKKFTKVVSVALVIAGLLQIFVYYQFGGIGGYMSQLIPEKGPDDASFKGMGFLFVASESFPILALMTFVMYATQHKSARSWTILTTVLLGYFVLLMLFGGLRGSRNNTLYSLFLAVGMFHLCVRPVSKKILAIGLMFALSFMYVYGFYKAGGAEGITAAFEGQASRTNMEKKSGRTFHAMLLGDLGRSDVQAFLLYRVWPSPTNYEYAWGGTYIGAAALLVPRTFWPDRPPTKEKAGTEAMFGRGSHQWQASNIYGLAGETILNFGPLAAPLAFIVLGLAVKKVRRMLATLDGQDARRLMIPFLVLLIVNILTSDSDNILWLTVKFGMVPFLVIATGCSKSFIRSSHLAVAR